MQNNTNRIFIKNARVRSSLTADLQLSCLVRSVPGADVGSSILTGILTEKTHAAHVQNFISKSGIIRAGSG